MPSPVWRWTSAGRGRREKARAGTGIRPKLELGTLLPVPQIPWVSARSQA